MCVCYFMYNVSGKMRTECVIVFYINILHVNTEFISLVFVVFFSVFLHFLLLFNLTLRYLTYANVKIMVHD